MSKSRLFCFFILLLCLSNTSSALFQPPTTTETYLGKVEDFCPKKHINSWRQQQQIEGVDIAASPVCSPDNPYNIAAFVKGTNNVSMATLMNTHLAPDTLIKGKDLDGDGDPDEIHIRLEVLELNGFSPDLADPVTTYNIAPGIQPGFWTFVPKHRGMSNKSAETLVANPLIRLPSPAIRVEQGDKVFITLENSHYFPHTIHLHGVDHSFQTTKGEGNDGVPQTSNKLIMPGKQFTYEITPRQPGTMVYHCHVQAHTHIMMGLIGMFIVEENRANNWVQTFNVGNGFVRHSSKAVAKKYDREYDLQYQDIDRELHNIIQTANDSRLLAKAFNRDYNITERTPDYFILNGRSFPFTLRESLIIVKPEEKIKLRVFNAGDQLLALHTHGFKPTSTHLDGVELKPSARIQRDVFTLGPAQRVDLELYAHNDGLHNMGAGIWTFHDHNELGVTTDGIYPGGHISSIVFESFLGENGMPKLQGVDPTPFFTAEFYKKQYPVWTLSDDKKHYGDVFIATDESLPAEDSETTDETQMLILLAQIIVLIGTVILVKRNTGNSHEA
ncbi:MAG: multicopper oxidase domain-containing protein [Methylococcales symbiont of Hymedesmia sp. n. MRB-2018]|nr:MAG: multicopper oxidase domain-containing protein [Methylococcales symbiont of Hymedesmia sp. n. MRB-2018]KAF3984518.1 MAG: multicopper oxidase domain-containing protein [Methylococcales symbiont of Hymedesmia sp. n. MRB-2018]